MRTCVCASVRQCICELSPTTCHPSSPLPTNHDSQNLSFPHMHTHTQRLTQSLGKECYFGGHPPLLEDGGVAMGEVTDGLRGAVAEVRCI